MANQKRKLCSKLMRVAPTFPGISDDTEGRVDILTSQYTCMRTVTPVGPDSDIVNPNMCGPGRSCYTEHN